MKPKQKLGKRELEVLYFILDHHPISVRQVAEQLGPTLGLARTTVLTVMERLRAKGYLSRSRTRAANQYSPRVSRAELAASLVRDFVKNSLGGSISPFVAYLAEGTAVTEQQRRVLEDLVRTIESREGEAE